MEHAEHLRKVLDRLLEVGLRLKPKKCVFARERVDYLGHALTADGVQPNSAKVEAVKSFPKPQGSQEFSWLGQFLQKTFAKLCSCGMAPDSTN